MRENRVSGLMRGGCVTCCSIGYIAFYSNRIVGYDSRPDPWKVTPGKTDPWKDDPWKVDPWKVTPGNAVPEDDSVPLEKGRVSETRQRVQAEDGIQHRHRSQQSGNDSRDAG